MLAPWDGGQAHFFLPDFPCRLGCSHRSRFLKYVKPLLVVTAAISSGQGRPPLGTLTSVVAGGGQQQWGDGPSRGKLRPLRGATSAHGVLHSVCPNNLEIWLHFHCGPSHSSRLFIYQTFIEQLSVSGESHQAPALWHRLTEKGDVSANGDGSGARKGGFLEEAVHLRYIPKNSSKRNSQGLSAKKGAMPERRGGFRVSRRVVYVVYRKGLRGHEDVSQSQGYKRKGTF